MLVGIGLFGVSANDLLATPVAWNWKCRSNVGSINCGLQVDLLANFTWPVKDLLARLNLCLSKTHVPAVKGWWGLGSSWKRTENSYALLTIFCLLRYLNLYVFCGNF